MENEVKLPNDQPKPKTKFFTKDKVCFFVIGLLLGGVIASAAFLIYTNVTNSNSANTSQNSMGPGMDGDTPPEMPDGSTPPDMSDGGTPPELPDGEAPADASNSDQQNSSTNDSGTSSNSRPQKPSNSNGSNNSIN